jgi:hypothetical protein
MAQGLDDWGKAIDAAIDRARAQEYRFWKRPRDEALARFRCTGDIELLVNGKWVPISKPLKFRKWRMLGDGELRAHGHGYLTQAFDDARAVGWKERWPRVGVMRVFSPPLPGGAERKPSNSAIQRARTHRTQQLPELESADLAELEEQALLGHTTLAERCAVMEQRANFFLGAAGLSTSLVLANSGLLLGSGKLNDRWLVWAAAFLVASTVCAVLTGWRAMQAAMATFVRATPNSSSAIVERAEMTGTDLTRAYIGALLVAQNREEVVGDWKLGRLKSARRWFLALMVGIALLAGAVLADVLSA